MSAGSTVGVMVTGWEERLNGTWVVSAVSYVNEPM